MGLIFSCRGSLIPFSHDFANNMTYLTHFLECEAGSPSKVARSACRIHIASNMWKCVVNTIQAAISIGCPTEYTWAADDIPHFGRSKIASINPFVCLSKLYGPTFNSFVVSLLACTHFKFLFRGHQSPSVRSIVSAQLSLPVTLSTFVGKTKRTRGVSYENLRSCRQFSVASIANAMPRSFGNSIFCGHINSLSRSAFSVKDGPHFQLPRAEYPA